MEVVNQIWDVLFPPLWCCAPSYDFDQSVFGDYTPAHIDEEKEPLVHECKIETYGAESNTKEVTIRDALQKRVGGETEVKCPTGRIDLLTATSLIEVKQLRQWKAALGQVLSYKVYYPAHKPELYLFGPQKDIDRLMPVIERPTNELGVNVHYEAVG